jgi:hypothetical protein
MPHMHRIVYDMYQEIVAEMNAQQQVLDWHIYKIWTTRSRLWFTHLHVFTF